MRLRVRIGTLPGRLLVAAMVLVTLGVGLCLFDADDHATADDGVCFDLCLGLAVVSIAVFMLTFVPIHALGADPPYLLRTVLTHRIDPPPKSASLA